MKLILKFSQHLQYLIADICPGYIIIILSNVTEPLLIATNPDQYPPVHYVDSP